LRDALIAATTSGVLSISECDDSASINSGFLGEFLITELGDTLGG
jgi:hypothetical protein